MSNEPQQIFSSKKIFILGAVIVGIIMIFAVDEIEQTKMPTLEWPNLPKINLDILDEVDCTLLSDYDPNSKTQTGWSKQCETANDQMQNSFSLLMVSLIVIGAIGVLSLVRMM